MFEILDYLMPHERCVCVFENEDILDCFITAIEHLPIWNRCDILAVGTNSEGSPMIELDCTMATVQLLDDMTTWIRRRRMKKSS